MKTPVTVKQLNAWLQSNFIVIEGASSAYLEFPFTFNVNSEKVMWVKRVVFVSLVFKGSEEASCKGFFNVLKTCGTVKDFQDKTTLLFIRTPFEVERNEQGTWVRGRLAFWEESYNEILIKSRAYVAQGNLCKEAPEEELL